MIDKKFYCVNRKHVLQALNGEEITKFEQLLLKVEEVSGPRCYWCVNVDEPYAKEVENLIRSHEQPEIICFIGRQGSGKDYQCSRLEEKGFKKLAFADALRDIAYTAIGITDDYQRVLDYDWMKAKPCITVDEKDGSSNSYTFRYLLEKLGTEGIRKYDNDFWCRALVNTLKKEGYKKVCISDMRFINEFDYLKKFAEENDYNFKVIFCDYHSDRYDADNNHKSAHMGNWFAKQGFKDLEDVTSIMNAYRQHMNDEI